jgi:hypothetical protein
MIVECRPFMSQTAFGESFDDLVYAYDKNSPLADCASSSGLFQGNICRRRVYNNT